MLADATDEDRSVQPQLDAIKGHLEQRGFREVHDHPPAPATPELHTILATCDRARCILRLDHDWLARHNARSAVAWLDSKAVADTMLRDPDADEVIVHAGGPGEPGLIQLPRVRLG